MQTFLPYSDFEKSFAVLDYKRLGKQRVEAYQVIKALDSGKISGRGWHNHVVTKMWRGYEEALKLYHDQCIIEWIKRGYNNNMEFKLPQNIDISGINMPWWLGNEDFHRSMRARLINKDKNFYLPLFPNDENFNDGKYLWPKNETKTFYII